MFSPSPFIPPQNVVYFLMLPLLVHKIFTFCLNYVLNCKCPAPGPKGNVYEKNREIATPSGRARCLCCSLYCSLKVCHPRCGRSITLSSSVYVSIYTHAVMNTTILQLELKLLLHSYSTRHLYVIYCMLFTNHEVCT